MTPEIEAAKPRTRPLFDTAPDFTLKLDERFPPGTPVGDALARGREIVRRNKLKLPVKDADIDRQEADNEAMRSKDTSVQPRDGLCRPNCLASE